MAALEPLGSSGTAAAALAAATVSLLQGVADEACRNANALLAAQGLEECARAAQQLELLQAHVSELAGSVQAAVQQAKRCLGLSKQASLLDALVGGRAYNRQHPRYAIDA